MKYIMTTCSVLFLISLFVITSCRPHRFEHKAVFKVHPQRNETYVFFPEDNSKTDFTSAVNRCKEIGSLVRPRDAIDQQFIQDLADGHTVWLGSQVEPGYAWTSRSIQIIDPMVDVNVNKYRNWASGEPECFTYCCGVRMNSKGKWGTHFCEQSGHVLCRIHPELVSDVLEQNNVTLTSEVKPTEEPLTSTIRSTTTTPTHAKVALTENQVDTLTQNILQELAKKTVSLETENEQLKKEIANLRNEMQESNSRLENSLNVMNKEFGQVIKVLIQMIEQKQ